MPKKVFKEPIYQMIGNLISKKRDEIGLSQHQLAKKLIDNGVAIQRTSITHIEKGFQRIMIHTLYDIANVLNANVSDFLPNLEQVIKRNRSESVLPSDVHGSEWVNKIVEEIETSKKGKK